ncbi:MAG TPA: hypothetical protein VMI31_19080 [Fimbriimonadaceae bacterium]|nr:hypothetical protein [Fimbriimonadaceae bacterium]
MRANILAEWTADQVRIRAQVTRNLIVVALCGAVAAVVVPVCETARARLAAANAARSRELAGLSAQVAKLSAAQKASAPAVAASQLHSQTSGYFKRLLQETYAVLDSADSEILFSSAKIEVHGAEIAVDCRADAQNYAAAAAFARHAGSSANAASSLASTRPSTLLSSNGVSFEYIKKVDLQ